MSTKIVCPKCKLHNEVKFRVIIDWVNEDERYGDSAAGRVVQRCKECGIEIINWRFEE